MSPMTPAPTSKKPKTRMKRFMGCNPITGRTARGSRRPGDERAEKQKAPAPLEAQGRFSYRKTMLGTCSGGGCFLGSLRGRRRLAAALGLGRYRRRFADQFCRHDAGDKELGSVIVKIDRRAFLVGRC